jgi:hypothetical protein
MPGLLVPKPRNVILFIPTCVWGAVEGLAAFEHSSESSGSRKVKLSPPPPRLIKYSVVMYGGVGIGIHVCLTSAVEGSSILSHFRAAMHKENHLY